MEARAKVTKELLCEESRFILANVMAEARYGRHNTYDDIRRICDGAVSIPFAEYVGFLDSAGYLHHDKAGGMLEVTDKGASIVNGTDLASLTNEAVAHFRRVRNERRKSRDEDGDLVTSGGRSHATAGGEIGSSIDIDTTESQSPGVLDGRYEKIEQLGAGSIGTVYRARQVALHREVAVKEIREIFEVFGAQERKDIVRRFSEVVCTAAGLSHSNILPVHDVNLTCEYPYVVCELATTGSVRRLIRDAEEIPVSLAVQYLLQTLRALQLAHAQKIIHRGLKPENLLIDESGNVKLSDFGLSRVIERDASSRHLYIDTTTIAYMAPELYTESAKVGVQVDIYALGIIFYELLARRIPGGVLLCPVN